MSISRKLLQWYPDVPATTQRSDQTAHSSPLGCRILIHELWPSLPLSQASSIFTNQSTNSSADALVKQVSGAKVGNGFDEGVTHGPIQNSMQYERVKGFFAEIETQGQKVAVGGKNEYGSKGYFITPTIVDNPPDDSRIVVEEPFGEVSFPVVKTTQAPL